MIFRKRSAFWWPRFLRIAHWFAAWDSERRAAIQTLHAEINGELKFPIGKREFTLSALADRIEQRKDGSYAIIDYKTGSAPTEKQVRTGLAPQLTLEAAMLRGGKFDDLPAGSVSRNLLCRAERRRAGRQAERDQVQGRHARHPGRPRAGAAEGTGGEVRERRRRPICSLVHPMWTTHYGDYDHLARVKEWSLTGGGDEGES